MKLAALYSGGKDSTYAIMKAIEEGHEVTHLVTIIPKNDESYMFHTPCIELTELQAKALGMKHIKWKSFGKKEEEIEDLRHALNTIHDQVDGVVSGAVTSVYQKSRIDAICEDLGLKSYCPLWGMDGFDVIKQEFDAGIQIMIVAVATAGLDHSWLGKRVDSNLIHEMKEISEKNPFNLQFEGGEAESFVTDCPIFKYKLDIKDYDKMWDNSTSSGYIVVKDASLVPK